MIEELLVYQQADAKLRKIEKEFSDSEDRKKAITAKKFLDGVEESVNTLDLRAAGLIKEYQTAEEEAKKLKEQEEEFSNAVKNLENNSEAEYLLKKIDEILLKLKNVSVKAGKIADDIQAVLKEYMSIKNATKSAQITYNESAKKYSDLKASKQDEKTKIEKELEGLKKKVDPVLMERYLKKRAAKIYPVIYEVNDKVCGACNMELSMSDLTKLKNGEIIECDHCGRLLYQK